MHFTQSRKLHFFNPILVVYLQISSRSVFDIKWVDETHALIIFPDANTGEYKFRLIIQKRFVWML